MPRSAFILSALIAGVLALFAPSQAAAQDSVKAPVRILYGFADDSGYAIAHLISGSVETATGRPVVIERKPGATGRIAAEALRNAAPDGATLLLAPIVTPILSPLVFKNLRYDPVKDFAPVTQVVTYRYVLAVGPNHPARTAPEFVSWTKSHRAEAAFGSPGAGTVPHFFGVLLGRAAGIELLHVPYKGATPLAADLMAGQIPAGIETLNNLGELHRAGRIRILAVSGAERSPIMPAVATFKEQGLPDLAAVGWAAVYAPAGTPKQLIDRLSGSIAASLRAPEVRDRFRTLGLEPTGTTAEELLAIMAADSARWAPIVKATGFVAE